MNIVVTKVLGTEVLSIVSITEKNSKIPSAEQNHGNFDKRASKIDKHRLELIQEVARRYKKMAIISLSWLDHSLLHLYN